MGALSEGTSSRHTWGTCCAPWLSIAGRDDVEQRERAQLADRWPDVAASCGSGAVSYPIDRVAVAQTVTNSLDDQKQRADVVRPSAEPV